MKAAVYAPILSLALALAACQQQPAPTAPEPAPAAPSAAAAPAPVTPVAPAPQPVPTAPETPAPPATSAQPCRDQIGEAAATALAEQCRMVSPATRPPCNAANPCEMIQAEIDRSCAMWARDGNAPKECAR
ncbi:MAG: hypothetical protein K5831_07070 [Brevundimonas sp.]|uniref:hypothetical protein n=1 Tax=Brevundimonas sp. TaxID=1871086 RepID=UPI0025879D2B|nr:hypothetical protein [Brevundimonas sp.]MCV0414629.1 hypothetical protein [Brevundimonas sp.]